MSFPSKAASAYDFTFKAIDGAALPLTQFRGKVVLVVNTASQCGFTPQYAGLKALYDQYKAKGLVVLGVPSNDFGGQEPGTADTIKQFCESRFDIDFPLTDKVDVVGPQAHPFYQWAAGELGAAAQPQWNFHKYLVAPDGHLAGWFPSGTAPDDAKLRAAVERLLPAS